MNMKLSAIICPASVSFTLLVLFPISALAVPTVDSKLAQGVIYEAPPTVAPISGSPIVAPIPVNSPQTTPIVPPAPVTSPQSSITFSCIPSGSGFATVVSNGSQQAPLITWNSNYFGAEYTPQVRCQAVSQRFQQATNANGGRLSNLILTAGTVNNSTVICATNKGQVGCNSSNMLFTLRPENAMNPAAVLNSIMQVGRSGSGSVVLETAGLPEVDLDRVVTQALQSAPKITPTYNPQITAPSPQNNQNNGYPNNLPSGNPVF